MFVKAVVGNQEYCYHAHYRLFTQMYQCACFIDYSINKVALETVCLCIPIIQEKEGRSGGACSKYGLYRSIFITTAFSNCTGIDNRRYFPFSKLNPCLPLSLSPPLKTATKYFYFLKAMLYPL